MIKAFVILIIGAFLFMACGPSEEEQISAIRYELQEQGHGDRFDVTIGSVNGTKAYIVDTGYTFSGDLDRSLFAFASILGCVARSIDSQNGILRVGLGSTWLDLSMEHVHGALETSGNDELTSYLVEHWEFSDR